MLSRVEDNYVVRYKYLPYFAEMNVAETSKFLFDYPNFVPGTVHPFFCCSMYVESQMVKSRNDIELLVLAFVPLVLISLFWVDSVHFLFFHSYQKTEGFTSRHGKRVIWIYFLIICVNCKPRGFYE